MRRRSDEKVDRVTLFFDPACPWTWLTSRWLVDAARARGVTLEYAALELSAGRPLEEVDSEERTAVAASRAFLRGVVAARRGGLHDLVGRWYTAIGAAHWDDGLDLTGRLVRVTLEAVGGTQLAAALDDAALDEALAASREEALRWAGDDVGSPVTLWELGDSVRGFFGPVLAPKPSGVRSDAIWTTVVDAACAPELFELKTRRTRTPEASPRPVPVLSLP